MNILFVIHQFLPEYDTGTEVFTHGLARAMQRAGHHVEVLTCAMTDDARWRESPRTALKHTVVDGIPVHGIPFRYVGSRANIDLQISPPARSIFKSFLRDREFDVAHVTHPMRMTAAIDALREAGIPYVLTLTDFFLMCYRVNLVRAGGDYCDGPQASENCISHCLIPPWSPGELDDRYAAGLDILNGAASVVACSEYVEKVFRREFGDLAIRSQRHGIDLLTFAPPIGRRDRKDVTVFGYVGTISDRKGVAVLVEAFQAVRNDSIQLKIVGPVYENQEYAVAVAAQASHDPRISIHAALPHQEIPGFMASIDVLCLPSRLPEAGSLTLQEGFAAGLPAVVSDIGFQAEAVKTAGCGLTPAPSDIAAWTDALERIALDPTLVDEWRELVPLPVRLEEEAAFYEIHYRHAVATATSGDGSATSRGRATRA